MRLRSVRGRHRAGDNILRHGAVQAAGSTPAPGAKKSVRRQVIIGFVLLAISAVSVTSPFIAVLYNQQADNNFALSHANAVRNLSQEKRERAIERAEQYNEELASDGIKVLGEVTDPWSGSGNTVSETDKAYRESLDVPEGGVMAFIKYPRLGINLPIRHGTSAGVLEHSVGHLYGTSLPIGGPSSHAVLSAHTGLGDRFMFDRLSFGEARRGDVFYVQILGETHAYKVISSQVIQPDDFSHFGVVAGQDLITLLTCTPYGLNTQRMIVTGERTTMPVPAPKPEDAPGSWLENILVLAVIGVWAGLVIFACWYLGVFQLRKKKRQAALDAAVEDTAGQTELSAAS